MRKLRVYLLTGIFSLISVTLFADNPPVEVLDAFKKMYPQVADVEWEKIADYYIADCVNEGQEMNIWFNKNAGWIMTETDVESLEAVPAPVAKAFMKSTLASMQLEYIKIITFPKQPMVIVIDVEAYNSDEEFQLFYAPDGTLLQTLNVSETGGEIYPGLFE